MSPESRYSRDGGVRSAGQDGQLPPRNAPPCRAARRVPNARSENTPDCRRHVWSGRYRLLKPRSALLASVCLLPALLVPSPYDAVQAQTVRHAPRHAANAPVPAGGTIADINVTGNHRIEVQTITSYMVVQPGGPFDQQEINESLKTLYATGLFRTYHHRRDGNDLDVAVVENPPVNQVYSPVTRPHRQGCAGRGQPEIALGVHAGRRRGRPPRPARCLRQAAAITTPRSPRTSSAARQPRERCVPVRRGDETKISRIDFVGNQHFSQSALREVVSSRQSAWWRFLSSSDQYDSERVEYDEYLLHQFYLHKGYADFRSAPMPISARTGDPST